MFFHSFRYALKQSLHQKANVFWSLLFPILLGTMFHIAFGGLSSGEQFTSIPVAVVSEQTTSSFLDVISTLSGTDEDSFLNTVHTTEEEALLLLEQKEIIGILYDTSPVTLSVSAEMTTMKLQQSILNSFVEQYNMQYGAMEQIALHHPEKLQDAAQQLAKETAYSRDSAYSQGNMDEQTTYFFNLIAMCCLFAFMSGCETAILHQANLSALGARKGISPVRKSVSLLGELCAKFLFQFLCVLVSLLYLILVLRVDFGSEAGYVILTALLGCVTGVSFGFCIGCIGHFSRGVKFGTLMAATMICCFLSGLMAGNIRIHVEKICPWFNHINPAALISDSFYALTIYQSHRRYFENSLALVLLSAFFCLCGFLVVRREKYAAL